MDQQRPTLSQSPLRMHNTKNTSGIGNNYSQKQLGTLAQMGNRGSDYKPSPIRESLIKNTGAFILGNPNSNANGNNVGSTANQPGVSGSSPLANHNNSG